MQDQFTANPFLHQLSIVAGYVTHLILMPEYAVAHERDFPPLLHVWVMLLVLVVAASCGRGWLEPTQSCRRSAQYLRRICLLLGSPLFVIASLPFTLDWRAVSALSIQWMLIALPFVLLSAAFSPKFSIADSPIVFLEVAAAAGALLLTLTIFVGPILKVIADIALYIGDGEYRSKIQGGFSRLVDNLNLSDRDVVFVGHSLGSVICANYLLEKGMERSGCRSVTLITMGSPLRRFFYRFFPTFSPTPNDLSHLLGAQLPDFKWINIFRPLDPIGTRLGSEPNSLINDVSTGQWHKVLLGAHIGYWSDPVVVGLIASLRPTAHPTRTQMAKTERWFSASTTGALSSTIVGSYSLCLTLIVPVCIILNAVIVRPREAVATRELLKDCSPATFGQIHKNDSGFNFPTYALEFEAVYPDGNKAITKYIPGYLSPHPRPKTNDLPHRDPIDPAEAIEIGELFVKVCYDTGPPFRFILPEMDSSLEDYLWPPSPLSYIASLILFVVSRKPIGAVVRAFCGYG